MKNFEEYFATNVILVMFLGVILSEAAAVTWFDGTRYFLRGTLIACLWMITTMSIGFTGVIMIENQKEKEHKAKLASLKLKRSEAK